jgi:hypothetical protein
MKSILTFLIILITVVGNSQRKATNFRIDLNSNFKNDTVSLIINNVEIFKNRLFTFGNEKDKYIPPMLIFKNKTKNLYQFEDSTFFKIQFGLIKIKLTINRKEYYFKTNLKKGVFINFQNKEWYQQKSNYYYF